MHRTIRCAIFGVLVSSGVVFAQPRIAPRPLLRPRLRVIGVRWFAPYPAVCFGYGVRVPFAYPVPYPDPYPYPIWNFIPPLPTYVFVGSASAIHPQLILKDGTTYTVTDYWRVNDQLHFITIEEGGAKSVSRTVPFEDLDVQRTTEADAAQGFRFVIRDEPIEQWLEHHAHRRHGNNGVS